MSRALTHKYIGERFRSLTVTGRSEKRIYGERLWECVCDCGKTHAALGSNLRGGMTTSCGCAKERRKTCGGMGRSPEYFSWKNAVARCCDEDHRQFKGYGGRGISVCDAWRGPGGFLKFLNHVGPRPTPAHSLDRIDNSSGYLPGNVRWATRSEQSKNRRVSRAVESFSDVEILLEAQRRQLV